ncbi:ATP-dependent nuclease [Nocardia sp. R16R-3T]
MMRLERLEVRRFRSIEEVVIRSFGDFNVLIGKNNSGKSNILAAIDVLFKFFALRQVATRKTDLNKTVDYFERDTSYPISITCIVDVGSDAVAKIVESIATEYPQVQNALPKRYFDLQICVEIRVVKRDSEDVQYVSSLSLVDISEEFDELKDARRYNLLEVSDAAAIEIAKMTFDIRGLENDIRGIDSFLENWDGSSELEIESRPRRIVQSSITRSLRAASVSDETIAAITSFVAADSISSKEIRTRIENRRIVLQEKLDVANSQTISSLITAYAGAEGTIPDYIGLTLGILASEGALHLADRRAPIGSREASRLLRLKMTRGEDLTLKSIQSTVQTLLGVKIDAFAGESSNVTARYQPEAELDVNDFLVEVNGSGVREALRVVLDVAFEEPAILLVEEPEVHLHPALEIAMLQHLKTISKGTQVFLTTHSTNFVDSGDLGNIYIVKNIRSTSVQHVDTTTAEDELPKELGIRLSSVFMFDRLVFVEGQTDETIIRSFATKLNLNLSEKNVGFVLMGGSRNFAHYAAGATLALLTKRKVDSFFVIDRDEQDDDGINKLSDQLGRLGTLHVLNRREIENYLIDPVALSKHIGHRLGDAKVSPDEIRTALFEIADELKDLTVAKRIATQTCRPYRADRSKILNESRSGGIKQAAQAALVDLEQELSSQKDRVDRLVESAEIQLASQWEEYKLDRVPGEELLGSLFKRYKLRFKKDRDGAAITELMAVEAIPPEISQLLRDICK